MATIINVPDVDFPIRFRQRVEGDLLEFRFAVNPESGRVELSVFQDDDPIFLELPLFTFNPLGLSYPETNLVFYATTEDGRERKVTEERIKNDVVDIRALVP